MDFFENLLSSPWLYAIDIVSMVSSVLLLLFMNYSAKHRNKKLTAGWYICGFFFSLITFLVFLSQRKKFPGPTTKVCYQCENRYPDSFQMCTRCLIDLPEIDKEENAKNEKKAKALCIGYVITQVISTVAGIALVVMMATAAFEELSNLGSSRIGVPDENGEIVYYDKMGNSYDDPYDVVIYDADGNAYTYTVESGEYYDDTYYVNEQGDKYDSYNCYVDLDGNFFYDTNYELYYDYDEDEEYSEDYSEDGTVIYGEQETESSMTDEELYDMMMSQYENYRYYDDILTDGNGNYYYWAEDASWNEKGELITAENDPNPPQIS